MIDHFVLVMRQCVFLYGGFLDSYFVFSFSFHQEGILSQLRWHFNYAWPHFKSIHRCQCSFNWEFIIPWNLTIIFFFSKKFPCANFAKKKNNKKKCAHIVLIHTLAQGLCTNVSILHEPINMNTNINININILFRRVPFHV